MYLRINAYDPGDFISPGLLRLKGKQCKLNIFGNGILRGGNSYEAGTDYVFFECGRAW